jgi:succinoglycan biosynthesis transport protein ExoP
MPGERVHTSSIHDFLRAIRRRWGVVLICLVVAPGAAVGFSLLQEKQYSASASLLFRVAGIDQQLFGVPLFTPRDPAREAATNEGLVSLDIVASRTAPRLEPPLSRDTVRDKVEIEAQGESDLVSITATDRSPAFAAQLANVFAQEYIVFRRQADRERVTEAHRLVRDSISRLTPTERKSERGKLLKERSQQLETIAQLQTGNAELVQPARRPSSPSSPKPVRNGIVGGVLGLLLGIVLALLLDRFDRRLRDPKDAEEVFDRPILGAIPESKKLPEASSPIALGGEEADAFRMLRANLRYFNVDREIKSLLVTSAAPGDGKSTVAWNLAAITAASGARVLLIEADLRHPVFADRYEIRGSGGLSGLLAGSGPIAEAVVAVPVAPARRGAAAPTMDVLVAGPLPPNPTDLLESKRTRELIRAAEQDYDLVIVDTPPTSVVPDAIPLLTEVSGVLIVSRLGKSTRAPALHLRHQLDNVGAPTLGVVINSLTSDAGGYYGYGYAYGYGPSAEEAEAAPPAAEPAEEAEAAPPAAEPAEEDAPEAAEPEQEEADAPEAEEPEEEAAEVTRPAPTAAKSSNNNNSKPGGAPSQPLLKRLRRRAPR